MCDVCHPEWVSCTACEGIPDTSMFDEGFAQLPVDDEIVHPWQVAGIDEFTPVDTVLSRQGINTFVTE